MSVYNRVRDLTLYELRTKGYAPNPADVVGIANQVVEIVKEEVEKALAENASKPSMFPSTPSTTLPTTEPGRQGLPTP